VSDLELPRVRWSKLSTFAENAFHRSKLKRQWGPELVADKEYV
jgi:hypothetical protein